MFSQSMHAVIKSQVNTYLNLFGRIFIKKTFYQATRKVAVFKNKRDYERDLGLILRFYLTIGYSLSIQSDYTIVPIQKSTCFRKNIFYLA